MDNVQSPKLVNPQTGEILQVNQLKPKAVEKALASLPNPVLSDYLSQINFVRRIADKLETAIKDFIKKNKELNFVENQAVFEEWKVQKVVTRRFNEKKLLTEGTEIEKQMYLSLKEKYTEESEYIKFG